MNLNTTTGRFEDDSARSLAPTVTFTPAAAAYVAGDTVEVNKVMSLFGSVAGGAYMINTSTLQVAHTAIISGETSYRMHLYNVTMPSALADNAVWDLPSGDRASYLGYVDLGSPLDLGSSLWVETRGILKQIDVPAGGLVYASLVTNGSFTATAAARKATLHISKVN